MINHGSIDDSFIWKVLVENISTYFSELIVKKSELKCAALELPCVDMDRCP